MSVPSISLYGILMVIPGLGISRKSAVIGLVLYSMLPIIRNVYTALNSTDPAIIEAARGVGMTSKDVLWKIRLPMALPIIFAGVRVAVVMMVGVHLGCIYRGKNLGRLLTHGIERTYSEMIIAGAIMFPYCLVIDYLWATFKKTCVTRS